ncbi:RNase adapter RapZ [Streptomyces sp. TX20-6-3]|uniref:RapZ C-terminal domain-containing protein n=1 Tax=Streptomyces sp. TX20-6-3 TaxID=3028705 RepID=UPI0029B36F06|nr:RNase adapter RapZ [Streptomyces sp. TX20-6-3]MDX2558509.1 RNase adapter RapZ [Streptomyces sp. TX20-6-3]
MAHIRITSYGTGHHDAPTAADPVVVDTTALRNPPDDPAVRARLTQLTGRHADVAAYVLATPGAFDLLDTARRSIEQRIGDGEQHIDVHVHCYGGRHRSVAIAEILAVDFSVLDDYVHVHHRHIDRPILPARTTA